MATPVFCCGFECGVQGSTGQHWVLSGTGSFSTTTVRSGARSARINPTAGISFFNNTALSSSNWVMRCYIYFASLPNADVPLFFTSAGGSARRGAYFKQSDSSIYAGSTISSFGSTGIPVTTGVWYRLDVMVAANIDVYVNGQPCGTATTGGAAAQTEVSIGNRGASATCDIYFDDIIISNTLADFPIGNGSISHFIPTSDGTHNIAGTGDFQRTTTGTDILNATTTAYQLIDDAPLESTPTDWINMVAPPNATDYVECVFGPASGSAPVVPPRAVEVIAGIHQAGTGAGNMEIRMNDNGTTNALYTATGVAGVTSIAYKRKHYAANIANGGAWTVVSGAGNFNNLRMRFGSPAAVDANPDQYLDCIMIEAEFAEWPQKIVSINQAVKRASYY